MSSGNAQDSVIKSDKTLFSIIEFVAEKNGARVTEIANYAGVAKSTAYKHLKTLKEYNYITQKKEIYYPSFKFLTIGGMVRDTDGLCNIIQPELHELAEEVDEMVLFSILEHNHGVFVFRINEKYGIRKALNLGTRFELHHNSSGKAMLAELPDNEIEQVLDERGFEAHTEHTITDRVELFDRIEKIRSRGFALNLEERREGLNAVGAAIYDDESDIYGAVTIAGASYRLPEQQLKEEYAEALMKSVSELQLKVRYS